MPSHTLWVGVALPHLRTCTAALAHFWPLALVLPLDSGHDDGQADAVLIMTKCKPDSVDRSSTDNRSGHKLENHIQCGRFESGHGDKNDLKALDTYTIHS